VPNLTRRKKLDQGADVLNVMPLSFDCPDSAGRPLVTSVRWN
jgi:hypothetical protein